MITRNHLLLCAASLLLGHGILHAGEAKPEMDSITFTGRWDLRAHDRAITVNTGSYLRSAFSGTAINAKFDVSLNKDPMPTLAWRIDQGDWQEASIAPDVQLASGLPDGPHTLWLMVRGIDEHQNRWTPPLVGSVTFLGLVPSDGGKFMPAPDAWVHPQLKMEFLGDSITEGVLVQPNGKGEGKTGWSWKTDALHSYAAQTAMQLDADWRQVGFGATGLAHGGSGKAASALDSLNSFYEGCPRDDWQPDVVVINQGTNDRNLTPDQYLPLYSKYLAMVRQAYPKARIVALEPFVGAQSASIQKAVEQAKAQGDVALFYVDTTGWYAGSLHPDAASDKLIADKLAAALKSEGL